MGETLQPDSIRVVLVGARNPLNIGAAARAMSNFGFLHLRVVNPYEVAFREARSAMGAGEVLQRAGEYATVADAVADCTLVVGATAARARDLQQPQYVLQDAAHIIAGDPGPVALLFGSEKTGLSNQDLAHCQWLLRIPTRDEHSSMNLGQAVAVCLYAIVRHGREEPAVPQRQPAPGEQLERLTASLMEALRASGYVKPGAEAATEENLRRLVRRLAPETDDAELLLGMVRQMHWKMAGPKQTP